MNGSSHGGWGRRDDKESAGPEICWDHEGSVLPLGLTEMTDEEREVCVITSLSYMLINTDVLRLFLLRSILH